jgi:hypothetical protein
MEARLSMQNLSQVLGMKQAHPAGTLFAVLSIDRKIHEISVISKNPNSNAPQKRIC